MTMASLDSTPILRCLHCQHFGCDLSRSIRAWKNPCSPRGTEWLGGRLVLNDELGALTVFFPVVAAPLGDDFEAVIAYKF